jgi:hypothetical protein
MNTHVAAIAAHDGPRKPRPNVPRTSPQPGDILASERSARADVFSISVIPAETHVVVTRYAEAIEHVRTLARTRRVDGWYTCDQTHYARVASYRS